MTNRFKVELDLNASTPNPQTAIWIKQHFCVSENHRKATIPSEQRCGEIILEHELKGNRGHWSVLDHAFVSFNCYGFPHSTMVQIRTHASSGLKVLAQSGRYTGDRFVKVAKGELAVEDVMFLSPVGKYQDRKGHRYEYTESQREYDLQQVRNACEIFAVKVSQGCPYELARETFPYEFRQDFGIAGTLRTIWHMLDCRSKKDSQWQIVELATLLMDELDNFTPELSKYYRENRFGKAITSP